MRKKTDLNGTLKNNNNLNGNNPTAKIGPLLKKYRERVRLTQSSVAIRANISSSMLSQIESSIVSPSVSTLFAICNAMGMDMVYLMKSIAQINPVSIYHPNERSREDYNNSVFETLISKQTTPHSAELQLLEIKPNQEIALRGKGLDVVAMGYVLAGSVLLTVEEKTEYVLKKGDSILFHSLSTHAFKNTGKTLFKAIWCLSPLRPDIPSK